MAISYVHLIGSSILVSIIILIGANQLHSDTSLNLAPFCDLVHGLQEKDILDGEVLIMQGDTIVLHEKSKGIAVVHDGEAQFLIGSVSKQFTAVALLHALYATSNGSTESEKCAAATLKLHSPLSLFLPADAAVWNGMMPEWAHEVTLHHLLTHSSGIADPIRITCDRSGFDGVWHRINSSNTIAERMSICAQESLVSKPGDTYRYLNEGYMLLAEVITVISGTPFTHYIETLCYSIGMSNTHYPDCGTWQQIKQQPQHVSLMPGLVYTGIDEDLSLGKPLPGLVYNLSNACGSGGIISTVNDLIKWNDALHRTKKMLPMPLYELFIKPNLNDYGYGIWNKNGILFHGGGIDAYSSAMMYIPAEDLLIIALCHIDYDQTLAQAECLLDTALQKVIPSKDKREPFVDKILGELAEKHLSKRGATLVIRWLMGQCFRRAHA
jgi:CubicO group peptidase (beta-lactamase class C family)